MTTILTPEQEAEIRRIVREELAAQREQDSGPDGSFIHWEPPIDPRVQTPPRRESDGL